MIVLGCVIGLLFVDVWCLVLVAVVVCCLCFSCCSWMADIVLLVCRWRCCLLCVVLHRLSLFVVTVLVVVRCRALFAVCCLLLFVVCGVAC